MHLQTFRALNSLPYQWRRHSCSGRSFSHYPVLIISKSLQRQLSNRIRDDGLQHACPFSGRAVRTLMMIKLDENGVSSPRKLVLQIVLAMHMRVEPIIK